MADANAAKKKSNKALVWILIVVCLLLVFVPLFMMRGASFGGSDDAGSNMVSEVTGTDYEPWFTPILTQILGVDELPGEVETLFFCIQTGIGVGILAFGFGYLVARKKYATPAQAGDEGAHPTHDSLENGSSDAPTHSKLPGHQGTSGSGR